MLTKQGDDATDKRQSRETWQNSVPYAPSLRVEALGFVETRCRVSVPNVRSG